MRQSRWWKGAGTLCVVRGCGSHTSGTGITGMCHSCAARKNAYDAMIPAGIEVARSRPAEERRARANHARAAITPAIRSKASRKAAITQNCGERLRAYLASLTPQQRSESARLRERSIDPQLKSKRGKKASDSYPNALRKENCSKMAKAQAAAMTPEQLRARSSAMARARWAKIPKEKRALQLVPALAALRAVRASKQTEMPFASDKTKH